MAEKKKPEHPDHNIVLIFPLEKFCSHGTEAEVLSELSEWLKRHPKATKFLARAMAK